MFMLARSKCVALAITRILHYRSSVLCSRASRVHCVQ